MSGIGGLELVLVLFNLLIVLLPLGAVLVLVFFFYQRLKRVEDKLDRLLEGRADPAPEV
jgi:hypothetical protein